MGVPPVESHFADASGQPARQFIVRTLSNLGVELEGAGISLPVDCSEQKDHSAEIAHSIHAIFQPFVFEAINRIFRRVVLLMYRRRLYYLRIVSAL